jgi:hypothetical protein
MSDGRKPLTQREADRCENAIGPVCRCRCGGAKHGVGRIPVGGDFSSLPSDDPHRRPAITRNQALRMLNNARNHVICGECTPVGFWTETKDSYDIWRATQDTINEAYESLKASHP